jgi:outer membrane protein assembly factor BamB
LWRLARGTPDVPSPLVHDGIVYLVGEGGSLAALDAKTGKEIYKKQVRSETHWASPVYADGKIYIQSRAGTTSVVQAGKNYKVLSRNTLDDQDTTLASPAVSGGRIYLRGYKTLWAIEEKK